MDWLLIRSLTLVQDAKKATQGCGLTSYSLFDIFELLNTYIGSVVDWLLIRSLTFGLNIFNAQVMLWIDFLFALWHSVWCYQLRPKSCGLTSYSLFDIRNGVCPDRLWVVDWLLIRSLTFHLNQWPQHHPLWIDFLFALWHFRRYKAHIFTRCGLTSYSLFDIRMRLCWSRRRLWIDFLFALWHSQVYSQRLIVCCGLTSYSLFDIQGRRLFQPLTVVDWLLIRSLTLVKITSNEIVLLWIDFLFALWHWYLFCCGEHQVVDWLLIRSLTFK